MIGLGDTSSGSHGPTPVTVFPFSRRFKILLGCCWPGCLSTTGVSGLLPIWTPLPIPCTFVMGKISPHNPSSFHNSHWHSEPGGWEVLSEVLSCNFGLWPGPPFPNVAYHRSVSTVQNAGPSWESRVLTKQVGEPWAPSGTANKQTKLSTRLSGLTHSRGTMCSHHARGAHPATEWNLPVGGIVLCYGLLYVPGLMYCGHLCKFA